eukprot:4215112-Pleurochrysis_carterae.AAC.1
MPLVGDADLNGTASSDSTDLRFDRPYRASSTGLEMCDNGLGLWSCQQEHGEQHMMTIFVHLGEKTEELDGAGGVFAR